MDENVITVDNMDGFADPDLKPGEKREEGAQECIYGKIPEFPTQKAGETGVLYDFNYGLRVYIPKEAGRWLVRFEDADTGIIAYNVEMDAGSYVASVKKYFVRWRLSLYRPQEALPAFSTTFDLAGRDVMIQLPVGTIGDSIAWFSYIERFQKKNDCRVICAASPFLIDLVAKQYPDITFTTKDKTIEHIPYASFYMGLFFKGDVDNQPIDFRFIGLHRTAGMILGLRDEELADEPPRFDLTAPRLIKEKYVCIATKASSQAKFWNNPFGWKMVIDFLNKNGYRVLCIDLSPAHGQGIVWNTIPNGCEDFTGNIPLQERVNLIKDADFFIGLSSGLSWLAWGCNVPVVMISGFTHPLNEFHTPYRVINFTSCNSCWNDMRCEFDHYDYLWCPRHKGDERQFECTFHITAEQVINTIKRIPSFIENTNK